MRFSTENCRKIAPQISPNGLGWQNGRAQIPNQTRLYKDLENKLLESGIRFIAPTVVHARVAADARLKYPLNLGDCFAYALAAVENCPILTTDPDFKKVNVLVLLPS
ncbi:MAG TPA: type II toxin-antitoxin system VapC family toxin [Acidobacteriota bacterium]|nr:type II toxin-antitoxin system VapC family toxin [Acidobacteriota bacterium]